MAAKRRRRRLKRGVSVGLIAVCLVVAGLASLLLTPLFNVKNIAVRGNKTVSREEIVSASGVIEGSNIFNISLSRVKKNVESLSRISSAKVRRVWPSTISIKIEEGAPAVYVYDGKSFVGVTSEGRAVGVYNAPEGFSPALAGDALIKADGEKAPEDKDEDEKDTDEKDADKEDADEEDEDEAEDEESAGEDEDSRDSDGDKAEAAGEAGKNETANGYFDRPIILGMGKMSYKSGEKIEFDDEVKAERLFKLINEFLCDDVCLGVSYVDMSIYDSISMEFGDLKVNLGKAEELSFKLKSFKAILAQIGENPSGTLELDLDRPVYSPKKK